MIKFRRHCRGLFTRNIHKTHHVSCRIAEDRNNELQEYLRDGANEIDKADQLGESRSGGDCSDHKLLGVWLDKGAT